MHLDEIPLDQVTNEDIHAAYLDKLGQQPTGVTGLLPDIFWTAGDLQLYKDAAEWWPHDAPTALALPTITELFPYSMGPEGASKKSASEVLNMLGFKCVAWLQSEGRDPARPNETKQQAQRRRAAEAMQRSRQLTRAANTNPAAARVKALHAAYIAACKARKDAIANVHQEHDPLVDVARQEWEAAKAEL